ncbi:MAG: alpha/beta hydrolase [Candidatus Azobacteroides sp.]|nr:alpha/beta hydrolase [Candidatus Azobacteroides sp.]
MKHLIFILILFPLSIDGQTIYLKSYGSDSDPIVIFIHGGPGGNSTLFESTTANILSEKGFFVIVYDRRGEGRSLDENATFTFDEASNDLNMIYEKYKIKKANLIAHSFGGIVATLYTNKYIEKVESIVLVDALFSQQETYDHILDASEKIFKNKKDTLMLNKVIEIRKLSKNSPEYRAMCYEIADSNHFFNMPKPTEEYMKLMNEYKESDLYKDNIRNKNSTRLFFKNEPLNNIDIKNILIMIRNNNVPLYAVYGKQDGIFSRKQLNDLKEIVGKKQFTLIDNCSHYSFVDQQCLFLKNIIFALKNVRNVR